MVDRPVSARGLKRIWKAFFHSLSGFRLAFRDEAAFRQELMLVIILSPICLILSLPVWLKTAILASHVLLLVVELLNTSIESVVNMISPEIHPLAKKAKDTASCAVLFCLMLSGTLWCYAIYYLLL